MLHQVGARALRVEALHDGVVSVEHHEGDVAADDQERDQLHHGFDGDGHDQPVLMLGRIRVARAEGDGEAREHERDDEARDRPRAGTADGSDPLAASRNTSSEDETAFSCRAI